MFIKIAGYEYGLKKWTAQVGKSWQVTVRRCCERRVQPPCMLLLFL